MLRCFLPVQLLVSCFLLTDVCCKQPSDMRMNSELRVACSCVCVCVCAQTELQSQCAYKIYTCEVFTDTEAFLGCTGLFLLWRDVSTVDNQNSKKVSTGAST